jgi:hypothetical protein
MSRTQVEKVWQVLGLNGRDFRWIFPDRGGLASRGNGQGLLFGVRILYDVLQV